MAFSWTSRAAQIWRDYVTDGVSGSGNNPPAKSAERTWGGEVENALDTLINAQLIYVGAQTTRAGVRGEVGNTPVVGSAYLSSAGKMYLKVANAAATTDWQRVTTTAAD